MIMTIKMIMSLQCQLLLCQMMMMVMPNVCRPLPKFMKKKRKKFDSDSDASDEELKKIYKLSCKKQRDAVDDTDAMLNSTSLAADSDSHMTPTSSTLYEELLQTEVSVCVGSCVCVSMHDVCPRGGWVYVCVHACVHAFVGVWWVVGRWLCVVVFLRIECLKQPPCPGCRLAIT